MKAFSGISIFLILGALTIFAYQNCSVYQSPQRQILEEKGFKSLEASHCLPYLDYNRVPVIWGEVSGFHMELFQQGDEPLEEDNTYSCEVEKDGTNGLNLDGMKCDISRAWRGYAEESLGGGTPQIPDATIIPDEPSTTTLSAGSFAYIKDANEFTTFAYVGAVSDTEIPMGVRCYFTFSDGELTPAAESIAWLRGREFVIEILEVMCDRLVGTGCNYGD